MIFAFSSIVLIKSLGDVFPMNKLGVTFRSDMIKPVVDTLVPKRRHKKFRSMDFIGSIFSKMLTSFAKVVTISNNWVESLGEKWCHYN